MRWIRKAHARKKLHAPPVPQDDDAVILADVNDSVATESKIDKDARRTLCLGGRQLLAILREFAWERGIERSAISA